MEIITAILGFLVAALIASILIASFFIWIAAKMAGIKQAGFGRAIGIAILTSVTTFLITAIFSLLPIIGTFLGLLVGFILSLLIIKGMFKTSFGKAFLCWIFNVIAQVAAIFLVIALGFGSLSALIPK